MSVNYTGDAATTRTNLGLGDAATKTTGTSAGNIPVLDGSGNMPAVDGSALTGIEALPSGGTVGQVVTNTGSGTGTWQDAAGGGGGAWTLIGSVTAGSDNSLVVVEQTSSYDEYVVVGTNLKPSSATMLRLRFKKDLDNGGGSQQGYDIIQSEVNSGNSTNMSSIDYNYAQIHVMRGDVDTSGDACFTAYIANRGTPHMYGHSSHTYSGTPTRTVMNSFAGRRRSAMTVGGIEVFFSSGTITSGRLSLYGINHA